MSAPNAKAFALSKAAASAAALSVCTTAHEYLRPWPAQTALQRHQESAFHGFAGSISAPEHQRYSPPSAHPDAASQGHPWQRLLPPWALPCIPTKPWPVVESGLFHVRHIRRRHIPGRTVNSGCAPHPIRVRCLETTSLHDGIQFVDDPHFVRIGPLFRRIEGCDTLIPRLWSRPSSCCTTCVSSCASSRSAARPSYVPDPKKICEPRQTHGRVGLLPHGPQQHPYESARAKIGIKSF